MQEPTVHLVTGNTVSDSDEDMLQQAEHFASINTAMACETAAANAGDELGNPQWHREAVAEAMELCQKCVHLCWPDVKQQPGIQPMLQPPLTCQAQTGQTGRTRMCASSVESIAFQLLPSSPECSGGGGPKAPRPSGRLDSGG